MKSARIILMMLVAGGMAGLPVAAQPATQPTAEAAPAASEEEADRLEPLIQMIRQAPEPSAAVEAYAKGQALERDSMALKAAYVEKMVEFGLPEMADTQAMELIQRDPTNGLAWAVAAYMSAKRGETSTALADIVIALKQRPDDPFVLRTAGQLLAWLDTRADRAEIPDDVEASVEAMRKEIAERPAFAEAYGKAAETYREQATQYDDEAAEQQPSATAPSAAAEPQAEAAEEPPPVVYDDDRPGYTYVPDTVYYDRPYTDPYVYVPYPVYYPWWPSTYSRFYWWPTFSSVLIIHHGFDRHHFKPHHRRPAFVIDDDFVIKHHDRFIGKHHRDIHRHHFKRDGTVIVRREGDDVLIRPYRERDESFRSDGDRILVGPDRDRAAAIRRGGDEAAIVRRGADPREIIRPDRSDSFRRDREDAVVRAQPPRSELLRDSDRLADRDRVEIPRSLDRGRDVPRITPPTAEREALSRRRDLSPRLRVPERSDVPRSRDISPRLESSRPPITGRSRDLSPLLRRAEPGPRASVSPRPDLSRRRDLSPRLRSAPSRQSPSISPSSRLRSMAAPRSSSPPRMSSSPRIGGMRGSAAVRGGGSGRGGGRGGRGR